MAEFAAILADPPWRYNDPQHSTARGGALNHYQTLPITDICSLAVEDIAADDACLFLWATMPKLPEALQVIAAWGFAYKTCAFSWVKVYQDGTPVCGLGNWVRGNVEICLLATRGRPERQAADVKQVIIAPVAEHSRKPDAQYERIERLVGGPYVELFARQRWPGWAVWGNETMKWAPRQERLYDVTQQLRAARD